ncbi:unnamed protein product [Lupinus luteus]|uniref:Methyltransferase n=1 Tax=Lupinus luteus TaxID=3873 RepID=A0AAV1YB70_LUPLU
MLSETVKIHGAIIVILALIALLGSSSSNAIDSESRRPVSLIYTNYRRIKEQAAVDYLELRSVSIGNLLSGFKEGEELDRHCDFFMGAERCSVRPPKEYKIPLRWPSGRDVIWTGNVKITKEATGSQVQLSLERGLPAMIGNFIARQLPYPSLSYDMVHCAQCGIIWDEKSNYIVNKHYFIKNEIFFENSL